MKHVAPSLKHSTSTLVPAPHAIAVWLVLAVALTGVSGCKRKPKERVRAVHIEEGAAKPRVNVGLSEGATNANSPQGELTDVTRTAADDLPCDVTTTWLANVIPLEEREADWTTPVAKWTRERAVGLLLTSDELRGPTLGSRARTPPQALAMAVLVDHPDGVCAIAYVLKRSGLPGRLYALSAAYLRDPELFKKLVVDYAHLRTPVPTRFGLIEGSSRTSELVGRIQTGGVPEAWLVAARVTQ